MDSQHEGGGTRTHDLADKVSAGTRGLSRKTPLRRTGFPRKRTPEAGAKASPKDNGTTTGLRRRTPIKSRNAKRDGSLFPHRRDKAYCAWIRTLPCCVAGRGAWIDGGKERCAGRVECAHVITRGAGGYDRANTVALCTRHHRHQHDIGLDSFERVYEIDLTREALAALWRYPGAPTAGDAA